MNENQRHVDDDAELYALGMLEDDERARIDAHLQRCDACAQRVGRAEAAVAAIAETSVGSGERAETPREIVPPAPRARRPNVGAWSAVAAAAAFAISTATLGAQNASLRGELRSDGSAMQAMVRSHFVHAQFVSPQGTPVDAKVIYERHGRWYQILALGADPSWRVRVVRDGAPPLELPQRFTMRADVGVVALPAESHVRSLQLLDGRGTVVGSVRPAVAAEETGVRPAR